MDEIVKAALAKWPNVPEAFGWLGLDTRGRWWLRDERAQRAGPFPQVRGSLVEHPQLLAFIGRNYEADARGGWFFQNGPQRVWVTLEAAPWIWRLDAGDAFALTAHTGRTTRLDSAWLDEHGRLFAATPIGLGLVHTLDVELAARAVERGDWSPREIAFAELPARFGYRLDPAG